MNYFRVTHPSPFTPGQDGGLQAAPLRRVSEDTARFPLAPWVPGVTEVTEVTELGSSRRPQDDNHSIYGRIQVRGAAHPAGAGSRPPQTHRAHTVRLVSSGRHPTASALHDPPLPHAQRAGVHGPDVRQPQDDADTESGRGHLDAGEGREAVPEGSDWQGPAHSSQRGDHDPEGQRSF